MFTLDLFWGFEEVGKSVDYAFGVFDLFSSVFLQCGSEFGELQIGNFSSHGVLEYVYLYLYGITYTHFKQCKFK